MRGATPCTRPLEGAFAKLAISGVHAKKYYGLSILKTRRFSGQCCDAGAAIPDEGKQLKVCSACKSTHYCNVACQKTHRKAHKYILLVAFVIVHLDSTDGSSDIKDDMLNHQCRAFSTPRFSVGQSAAVRLALTFHSHSRRFKKQLSFGAIIKRLIMPGFP